MASSNSSVYHNNRPPALWQTLASYSVPPVAAAVAIVPVFRDMIAKTHLQKGEPIPHMTIPFGLWSGLRAAPTVGAVVGGQMVLQNVVERVFTRGRDEPGLSALLASSAVVGMVSSPVLAIFNGQTMGWSVQETLRRFSVRQGLAISVQEAAFVAGLRAADKLSVKMKEVFGDNKGVEYTAAFIAGGAGSLAGHPANTMLTRWQSGKSIESANQLMWGALRKARAVAFFALFYKLGKEALNLAVGC